MGTTSLHSQTTLWQFPQISDDECSDERPGLHFSCTTHFLSQQQAVLRLPLRHCPDIPPVLQRLQVQATHRRASRPEA